MAGVRAVADHDARGARTWGGDGGRARKPALPSGGRDATGALDAGSGGIWHLGGDRSGRGVRRREAES
eukprot:2792676-Pleurochrysis_carterae.AAC.1